MIVIYNSFTKRFSVTMYTITTIKFSFKKYRFYRHYRLESLRLKRQCWREFADVLAFQHVLVNTVFANFERINGSVKNQNSYNKTIVRLTHIHRLQSVASIAFVWTLSAPTMQLGGTPAPVLLQRKGKNEG